MKKIALTKSKYALVDDEDYEGLIKYKWYFHDYGYAVRKPTTGIVRMHRLIIGAEKGEIVDHINRNRLDNRKSNLRLVNKALNNHNSKLSITNSSGLRGVSWFKRLKKWRASITVNSKSKHLGLFISKNEAGLAYKKAAKEVYGF